MDKKIIEKLSEKFPKECIKQRPCPGMKDKKLDYIEGSKIIQRLNDVFGAAWTFEVVEPLHSSVINDSVVVKTRLTVPNIIKINEDGTFTVDEKMPWIIKENIGGKKITMKKKWKPEDPTEQLDLGNDFKASVTDGLKKCATLLGIALELYDTVEEHKEDEKGEEAKGKDSTTTEKDSAETDNAPAGENQIKAIEMLAKMTGSVKPEVKTYKEAREWIVKLQSLKEKQEKEKEAKKGK